jgi:hypothetical protein
MPTATIVLEDHDGQIACRLTFSPAGFDPTSHAHQHAQIMLTHMDGLCTKAPESETVEMAPPEPVLAEPKPQLILPK